MPKYKPPVGVLTISEIDQVIEAWRKRGSVAALGCVNSLLADVGVEKTYQFKRALEFYADANNTVWEETENEPSGLIRRAITGTTHPANIARQALGLPDYTVERIAGRVVNAIAVNTQVICECARRWASGLRRAGPTAKS